MNDKDWQIVITGYVIGIPITAVILTNWGFGLVGTVFASLLWPIFWMMIGGGSDGW